MTQSEFFKSYRGKLCLNGIVLFINMLFAFFVVHMILRESKLQIVAYGNFLRNSIDNEILSAVIGGATGGLYIGVIITLVCVPGMIMFRRNLFLCPKCQQRLRRKSWRTGQCSNCQERLFDVTKS